MKDENLNWDEAAAVVDDDVEAPPTCTVANDNTSLSSPDGGGGGASVTCPHHSTAAAPSHQGDDARKRKKRTGTTTRRRGANTKSSLRKKGRSSVSSSTITKRNMLSSFSSLEDQPGTPPRRTTIPTSSSTSSTGSPATTTTTTTHENGIPSALPVIPSSQWNRYDVLVGRGNGIARNPGNIFFRCVVWDAKEEYRRALNANKLSIAQERVIDVITGRGGRILEPYTGVVTSSNKKNTVQKKQEENTATTNRKKRRNTKQKNANKVSCEEEGDGDDEDEDCPGEEYNEREESENCEYFVVVSKARALEKACQALREKKNLKPPEGYEAYCREKVNNDAGSFAGNGVPPSLYNFTLGEDNKEDAFSLHEAAAASETKKKKKEKKNGKTCGTARSSSSSKRRPPVSKKTAKKGSTLRKNNVKTVKKTSRSSSNASKHAIPTKKTRKAKSTKTTIRGGGGDDDATTAPATTTTHKDISSHVVRGGGVLTVVRPSESDRLNGYPDDGQTFQPDFTGHTSTTYQDEPIPFSFLMAADKLAAASRYLLQPSYEHYRGIEYENYGEVNNDDSFSCFEKFDGSGNDDNDAATTSSGYHGKFAGKVVKQEEDYGYDEGQKNQKDDACVAAIMGKKNGVRDVLPCSSPSSRKEGLATTPNVVTPSSSSRKANNSKNKERPPLVPITPRPSVLHPMEATLATPLVVSAAERVKQNKRNSTKNKNKIKDMELTGETELDQHGMIAATVSPFCVTPTFAQQSQAGHSLLLPRNVSFTTSGSSVAGLSCPPAPVAGLRMASTGALSSTTTLTSASSLQSLAQVASLEMALEGQKKKKRQTKESHTGGEKRRKTRMSDTTKENGTSSKKKIEAAKKKSKKDKSKNLDAGPFSILLPRKKSIADTSPPSAARKLSDDWFGSAKPTTTTNHMNANVDGVSGEYSARKCSLGTSAASASASKTTAFPSDLDDLFAALPPSLTAFASGIFHSSSSAARGQDDSQTLHQSSSNMLSEKGSMLSSSLDDADDDTDEPDFPALAQLLRSISQMSQQEHQVLPTSAKETKADSLLLDDDDEDNEVETGNTHSLENFMRSWVQLSQKDEQGWATVHRSRGHTTTTRQDTMTLGDDEEDLTDIPPPLAQLLRSLSSRTTSQQWEKEGQGLAGYHPGDPSNISYTTDDGEEPGDIAPALVHLLRSLSDVSRQPPEKEEPTPDSTNNQHGANNSTADEELLSDLLAAEDFSPGLREITKELFFEENDTNHRKEQQDRMDNDHGQLWMHNDAQQGEEFAAVGVAAPTRMTRAVTHDVEDEHLEGHLERAMWKNNEPSAGAEVYSFSLSPSTVMDPEGLQEHDVDVVSQQHDPCDSSNDFKKPPPFHANRSWSRIAVEPPSLTARHSLQHDELDNESKSFATKMASSSEASALLSMLSSMRKTCHSDGVGGHHHHHETTTTTTATRGSYLPAILVALGDDDDCGNGGSGDAAPSGKLGHLFKRRHRFLGPVQVLHVETQPGGTSRIILKGLPSRFAALGGSSSSFVVGRRSDPASHPATDSEGAGHFSL
ncbi:hypothetical protein ACA910_013966 [Epithemia clementina (nom. ined.)]